MNQAYLKNILSAKFDFDIWKDLLEKIFPKVEVFTSVAKIADSHVKDGGHVGNIRLDDGRSLAIFRFEVTDNVQISRNRKSLRDIAAKYVDQGLIHGALVFYYSQNQGDYRLTFIAKQTYFNESGELIKKETAPKRYTFLLGKNEPCTTAASRLKELADKKNYGSIYLTDVIDAFSVERLNKEFFNGYKAQYKKFVDMLSDTKTHRDYVKKLLGRLVFLQFLQKKGWMGVPASNANWEGGDKNYLSKLVDTYANNNRLLSDVLEPLFFKTLNEKRNGDIADSILGENIKIPYLNGGLFDKDRIDELDIDFPYDYFKELMDFFAMYNFTIDENDPEDSEIGIDPEMLGHIFENLLEDNKDKGAFYTPKEIVQYMSQESVAQYLKSHAPEELHTAIDSLIKQRVVEPILQNKDNARLVNKALSVVKVCDPAIGSGAFPMGVLNVLFDCRHLLYGFIGKNEDFSYAKVKRDIIQNNIYGVDIEKGAVDIARLRFWLALVVDEIEPQPLPNLDYKIMCGDSLLHRFALDAPFQNVLKDYNQKNGTHYTLDDYSQWVYDYTDISDHTQKDSFRQKIEDIKRAVKTELSDKEKGKIAKVRGAIANLQMGDFFGDKKKENEKKIKALQKELKALEQQRTEIESNKIYDQAFEWRFEFPALLDEEGDFMGFDIVIGNPPYGAKLNNEEKNQLKRIYDIKTSETAIIFIEQGIKLLNEKGTQTYIIPKAFTFASNYSKIRDYVQNQLSIVVDCGKAFEKVKLEACIILNTLSNTKNDYNNLCFVDDHFDFIAKISKATKPAFGFFLNGVDEISINLGMKIKENSVSLGDISTNNRGEPLQRELLTDGTYPVIGGKDIDRESIRSIKGFVNTNTEIGQNAEVNNNSLLFQNIVAHITEPYPQIKLIGCVPNRSDVYIVDTINQISVKEKYSNKYIWCLLNSKLICWYVYNFIYGKAIRTMHFDSVSTDRIPIKIAKDSSVYQKLWNQFVADGNDKGKISNEIDLLVYHLYGLTYDEVLIVDPETPITREVYEKKHN